MHGFITRFIGSNFRKGKWKLENFQREEIINGLKNCEEEDIIMVSDIDEIPRPEKIKEMASLLKNYKKVGFKQDLFNHYLNGYVNSDWIGTKAVKFRFLKNQLNLNPQKIRLRKFHFQLKRIGINEKIKIMKNGGWHFNNVGKREEILKKFLSKAESDLFRGNLNKKFESKKSISSQNLKLKIVTLDNSFPKSILKNKKKYSFMIHK